MGNKKRRREAFFAAHPKCCFCGGVREACEEDHQPARVFFANRQWPEGFVFPACSECNRVSKDAENLLALIAANDRVASNPDYRTRLEWAGRNHPEIVKSVMMSSRAKRTEMKRLGLEKPDGITFAELPLMNLEPEIWDPLRAVFYRKLALALFYKFVGSPLPPEGRFINVTHSNIQLATGDFPLDALDALPLVHRPMRQDQYLGDQFLIRYNFSRENKIAAFVVGIQNLLIFSSFLLADPTRLVSGHPDWDFLRPFGPYGPLAVNGRGC